MPFFWVDTSVFIQAHQGPYAFDIAPGFWDGLHANAERGLIRSPAMVLGEITGDDPLAVWARSVKNSLFVDADATVQTAFTPIASHVQTTYRPEFSAEFLAKADPWVIAHAKADSGVIVTQENSRRPSHVKIPVVGRQFGVQCIDTYELMRRLGIKLM